MSVLFIFCRPRSFSVYALSLCALAVSALVVSPLAEASPTVFKSTSSSIDAKDCIKIKSDEYDNEANQKDFEYYEMECPGYGGYQILVGGKDSRFSLSLKYNGRPIEIERPTQLHNLNTTKIEWFFEHNLNETVEMKALIFELYTIDDSSLKSETANYVVKLNGEKSCLTGREKDLESARKIAEDNKAKCLPAGSSAAQNTIATRGQ